MAICSLSDLPSLLTSGQSLLGLDPGRVTIGVAISNPDLSIASPLTEIKKTTLVANLETLKQIVDERHIGGLVIGLPKNLDGTEGPAAQAARTFASNILRQGKPPLCALPIGFWDERFSTAAVTRFMLEDDMSRKRRQEVVDKAAAAYILQGALDSLQVRRKKS